jgi:hypothetical protein
MLTVMANSRSSRPTSPPIRSTGMNTAISETLIEITVKMNFEYYAKKLQQSAVVLRLRHSPAAEM